MTPESLPHPALIVVDLLVDFFDPKLWPESPLPGMRTGLVEGLQPALAWFRKRGRPVIWVRQAFAPDLSDAFPHMRRTGRVYTIRGTAGAEFLPELDVRADEAVIRKTRFSAFFGTGLAELLAERGCESVVLAGITTSWCIRSTATDAYQHDLDVCLLRDCLGGFSREDHARDLAAMDGYIARVMENGVFQPGG